MPILTGTPTTFQGLGRVEWAPTNAPDDPFPTWVDITAFVRSEDTPMDATRGRQSELDTVQPSTFTVVLDNTDGRFTFGLTSGPYGINWAPAKQIRWTDTIGSRTFVIFQGFLEAPDVNDWRSIGYQEISLSCTDRLTRLGRGQPFLSTLGEQIKYRGRSTLVYYAPMHDVPAVVDIVSGQAVSINTVTNMTVGANIATTAGSIALADDIGSYLTIASSGSGLAGPAYGYGRNFPNPKPPMATGQAITVVFWIIPQRNTDFNADDPFVLQLALTESTPPASGLLSLSGQFTTQQWRLQYVFGGMTGDLTATSPLVYGQPAIVGCHYGFNPATFEFWIGSNRFVGSLAGSPPASAVLATLNLPVATAGFRGSLSHCQVYIAAEADWGYADFLAQQRAGLTGLAYQSTGQRINTILDYAGVPASARAIDPGCSYMQVAALADEDPGSALANAVATERGRGFISGDGKYVFHDRTRIYNV
jgi:hypothetical protein